MSANCNFESMKIDISMEPEFDLRISTSSKSFILATAFPPRMAAAFKYCGYSRAASTSCCRASGCRTAVLLMPIASRKYPS